jgi:hypothetical protein
VAPAPTLIMNNEHGLEKNIFFLHLTLIFPRVIYLNGDGEFFFLKQAMMSINTVFLHKNAPKNVFPNAPNI